MSPSVVAVTAPDEVSFAEVAVGGSGDPGRGLPAPRRSRLTTALVATDIVAIAATGAIFPDSLKMLAVFGFTVMLLNAGTQGYASRLTLSVVDELPYLVARSLLAAAIGGVTGLLITGTAIRGLLFPVLAVTFIAVFGRGVVYWQVRRLRRIRAISHPTIILGAGQVGGLVAQTLLAEPEIGLNPIGFLDDDPLVPEGQLAIPILGSTSELSNILQSHHVSNVVLAFSALAEPRLVEVVRTCDRLSCEIFCVPRLFEVHRLGGDSDRIGAIPITRLRRAPFRSFTWRLKRVFDVAGSLFALTLLAPVLIAAAVATWASLGRPILYRQMRVGLDGAEIEVLKFRTFPTVDSSSDGQWNIAHDNRVRPVGRFLRRTSLDELPQFWNVLRGDMSLVGPRPERPQYVREFATRYPRYLSRHRVPCGITGWSQVNGLRGDTSIEERVRYDNFYIENWSLWGDVKILLRTFGQVVRGAGA